MKNYEKLGKNQYTLHVPSTEKELEKLESENLSENELKDSADFWGRKYLETTGADQLKSLVSKNKVYAKVEEKMVCSTPICFF